VIDWDGLVALAGELREFLFDSWLLATPKRLAAQFQPE
jgi:hypothetical protein